MDQYSVRPFKIEDYQQVIEVWVKAGLEIKPGDDLDSIKKKLERDPELFLVAECGSEIIGTVMGAYDGRRGWIYHLATAPAYQRRGVARLLMSEVESKLLQLGCPKINLLVVRENTDAMHFYNSIGFYEQNFIAMGKTIQTIKE